jgi:hypothetical protein
VSSFNLQRFIVVITIIVSLAGCSDKPLAACTASTEPAILLRQLALTPLVKRQFDNCLSASGKRTCEVIFLNSDNLMRDCMSQAGYSISGGPACKTYYDPSCYRPTWLNLLLSAVGF